MPCGQFNIDLLILSKFPKTAFIALYDIDAIIGIEKWLLDNNYMSVQSLRVFSSAVCLHWFQF